MVDGKAFLLLKRELQLFHVRLAPHRQRYVSSRQGHQYDADLLPALAVDASVPPRARSRLVDGGRELLQVQLLYERELRFRPPPLVFLACDDPAVESGRERCSNQILVTRRRLFSTGVVAPPSCRRACVASQTKLDWAGGRENMSSTHGEVQKLIDDHPTANGLVVVLTNDYESSHLPTLGDACHKDGDEMEETFKNMFGFACFRRKNTTGSEIKAIIKAVGEINYSPTYKCVAIAFSGHGKKDSVQGNDKGTVKIYEDFVGPLQPRRKGHLNNVPKLFFFDACRGSLEMRRLREKGTVDERGGFYLAYATTEGFTAYLQSKWMPKVAQKLRDRSNVGKTVQEVVGKVTKEFRESSEPGYQCPQCDDTYGPVYIHSGELLVSWTRNHLGTSRSKFSQKTKLWYPFKFIVPK